MATAFLQGGHGFSTGQRRTLRNDTLREVTTMAHIDFVPMTIEEIEALVRAIDADRRAGRRTRREAEEEIAQLAGGR
jgi:hypothetical protein